MCANHEPFFRAANMDDVPHIVSLVNSAYRPAVGAGGWTHEADLVDDLRVNAEQVIHALEHSHVLVAVCEGQLCGCVQIDMHDGEAHIGMLAVSPFLQTSGLGKKLLSEAEQHAKNKSAKCFVLLVVEKRAELIEFYLRRGYQNTGSFRAYPVAAGVGVPRDANIRLIELRKNADN